MSLLFRPFGYRLIRKMKVCNALVWSAILFLAAAVLITFGPTLPFVIAGQCLYVIAPAFYDVMGILIKELCRRDTKGKDYVQSSSLASTLYSVNGVRRRYGAVYAAQPLLPGRAHDQQRRLRAEQGL